MPRKYACLIAMLTTVFFLTKLAPTIQSQVYTGSLTGVVTDPSGAIVPGAKVGLVDRDKGFTYDVVTGADGRYVLRNLPPGNYELTVDAAGLRKATRTGIVLNVGQNAEVNVSLEVSSASQTVEVSAAGEQLGTQDAVRAGCKPYVHQRPAPCKPGRIQSCPIGARCDAAAWQFVRIE